MAIPDDPGIKLDAGDMKPWRVGDIADMQKFQVLSMTADISQLVAFRQEVFGRRGSSWDHGQLPGAEGFHGAERDREAVLRAAGGGAAALQAGGEGRGWSMMFEVEFKFLLAYTDEARPVVRQGITGSRSTTCSAGTIF
jgi:hypothetical protein